MPTTIEAKEAKTELCRDLCKLIRDYEITYGVGVRGVDLIRSQTLDDPTERTTAVEVRVDL